MLLKLGSKAAPFESMRSKPSCESCAFTPVTTCRVDGLPAVGLTGPFPIRLDQAAAKEPLWLRCLTRFQGNAGGGTTPTFARDPGIHRAWLGTRLPFGGGRRCTLKRAAQSP